MATREVPTECAALGDATCEKEVEAPAAAHPEDSAGSAWELSAPYS